MSRLHLYHRHGCHLCDEMLDRLQTLQRTLNFDLAVEDVDADSRLAGLYNDKVPVLVVDGVELCHHFLDEGKLLTALGEKGDIS